jgi:hypothetical protein
MAAHGAARQPREQPAMLKGGWRPEEDEALRT